MIMKCFIILTLVAIAAADYYALNQPRLLLGGWGKKPEITISKGWGWKKSVLPKGLGIYGGIRFHHKDPGSGGWGGWGGGWGLRLQSGWGKIQDDEGHGGHGWGHGHGHGHHGHGHHGWGHGHGHHGWGHQKGWGWDDEDSSNYRSLTSLDSTEYYYPDYYPF